LQFAHFILSAGRVDAGSVRLPSRRYRVRTPANQAPIAAHSIGKADQSTLDAGAKSFVRIILTRLNENAVQG
jgi:hypothetical protein